MASSVRLQDRVMQFAGLPIPILLSLYTVALMTSMSGMEIFGWATALFTLIYIILDRLTGTKSFHPFRLGVEVPLFFLLVVVITGLRINAPDSDFVFQLGQLRWIVLLYILTYALAITKTLNRSIYIVLFGSGLVGAYAIFQHFTGLDLVRGDNRAVTPAPFEGSTVFQNTGFLDHHLTYGYSMGLLFCLSFAALVLSQKKPKYFRIALGFSTTLIGLSLLWTYGRGVWIASLASIVVMTTYISKRHVLTILAICAVIGSFLYTSNPGMKERISSIWSDTHFSNTDRRDLWKANWLMFRDHPWVGVGYQMNEARTMEYFDKLGMKKAGGGHAHNNYIQMLSTTGLLGFLCYMLFVLSFLLMSHRLWTDVPRTHYWHRVLALGILGAQIHLHTGGLTQWNFGDAEVNHVFIFLLAVTAYLTERYSRGVVPDDFAL